MFLKVSKSGYNAAGEQFCHGLFLVIFDHPDGGRALRGVVVRARMRQLGAWMMATVKIGGQVFSLSGTYGGDGLPCTPATDELARQWIRDNWEQLYPLPAEIRELFWKDDGHNSSGKNGPAIHDWALQYIDKLKLQKKKVSQ